MVAQQSPTSSTADREIVIIRTIDAPPNLVWRAWTDPKQVGLWWGPNGFTTTTYEMNVMPGGVWRFDMHGPDGRTYPNQITFHEVVECERLVYSHGGEADVSFQGTVTFEKQDDKTKLTLRMIFPTAAARDRVEREYGAVLGGIQHVGRLAAHLGAKTGRVRATMTTVLPSACELMVARDFAAPRKLVWDAWTKPEILKQWLFGPEGWSLDVCEVDVRVGGKIRYEWRRQDGVEMGMSGEFRDVEPPIRMVHTEIFDQDWTDGEAVVTTTFMEENGVTTVLMTVKYSSQQARDGAVNSGMEYGMALGYERLDKLFATMSAK